MNFDDLSVILGRVDDLQEVLAEVKPNPNDEYLLIYLREKIKHMREYVTSEIRYRSRQGDAS